MQYRERGFTIVELLIVIVVIGILAAITVVAYNGIQTRGENQKTISAVKEYVKAFHAYAIDNGNYPQLTGCLGEGYPDPNNYCLSQSGLAECWGTGAAVSTALSTALKTYMNGSLPSPSMQKAACGNTSYVGAYAAYVSASKTVVVYMILRGDQTCPPMSPNASAPGKVYGGDATRCMYTLAAVS